MYCVLASLKRRTVETQNEVPCRQPKYRQSQEKFKDKLQINFSFSDEGVRFSNATKIPEINSSFLSTATANFSLPSKTYIIVPPLLFLDPSFVKRPENRGTH
mgnify:CR=1 FL=1